ncbi:hypothetical protein PMG11_06348 [Penicillium brasilianum]|uniref:Uncharacterized protein n=1 Tax=Penicillium brasilianum TaxID=104259 RepID=A0A0F7TRL9_PENBI|nr:hypothetical protein PMG11_06348 [Penicillium brasilianum]
MSRDTDSLDAISFASLSVLPLQKSIASDLIPKSTIVEGYPAASQPNHVTPVAIYRFAQKSQPPPFETRRCSRISLDPSGPNITPIFDFPLSAVPAV